MKRHLSGLLAAGCVLLLGSLEIQAETTYIRLGEPRSGLWSTPELWSPSTGAPAANGDVADFTLRDFGDGATNPRTVIVDDDPVLLGMVFRYTWTLQLEEGSVSPRVFTLQADPNDPGVMPYLEIATTMDGRTWSSDVILEQGITVNLIGGAFRVGAPEASTGYRSGNGDLVVKGGAALNIGTEEHRSEWRVAQHYRAAAQSLTSSVVAETETVVSAWLTELRVGGNNAITDGGGSNAFKISGTVDLSAATVTAFDVSGDVVIGRGTHHIRGSSGAVLLPEVDGRIGGNVLVGDSVLASGENFGSAGLLDLNGTHLEVGGDVMIDLTGRVKVTLGEGAGGLRLSEGSGLTINAFGAGAGDEDAGYFIDFTNATFSGGELLYGFAWEGDQLDDLTALVNSHAITWSAGPDGLTAGLFYDAGADLTYIGIAPIPEPGTVSLLLGGAVLLGWAARKRLADA